MSVLDKNEFLQANYFKKWSKLFGLNVKLEFKWSSTLRALMGFWLALNAKHEMGCEWK